MHSVSRSTPGYLAWLLPLGTLFFMCGILLGRSASTWPPALAALVCSLLAGLLLRHSLRALAVLLCAASFGALLGWPAWHPALPEEGTYHIVGTVAQEVSLREDGQVQTVLQEVTLNGEKLAHAAYWTYYLAVGESLPDGLMPGARVSLAARVYHPGDATNPGGFSFREYLLQRDITVGVYGADDIEVSPPGTLLGWIAHVRHDLAERLMAVMGQETGAYAAAMLLGEREFLPERDQTAFRTLGIAHILSVSGYHVGVLTALLLLLLRPTSLPRRWRIPL